jgi:hypothetical protein
MHVFTLKDIRMRDILFKYNLKPAGTLAKQSHFRPGQALRIPGQGSQFPRHSAHEGGMVFSLTHWPPLLLRIYSWYSFLLEAE